MPRSQARAGDTGHSRAEAVGHPDDGAVSREAQPARGQNAVGASRLITWSRMPRTWGVKGGIYKAPGEFRPLAHTPLFKRSIP